MNLACNAEEALDEASGAGATHHSMLLEVLTLAGLSSLVSGGVHRGGAPI